jgi:hypothetical protein
MKYRDTNFRNVQVAGVTFDGRQETLRLLQRTCPERNGLDIRLIRDAKNVYDPNAVQIWAKPKTEGRRAWRQIGFVPRESAKSMAKLMDTGSVPQVGDVTIIGGYADKSVGVRIDVTFPNRAAKMPPTERQMRYIRDIKRRAKDTIPEFMGTTRQEATEYITRYQRGTQMEIVFDA